MNKIQEFIKKNWVLLHSILSVAITVISALVCIAISGPATAIYSALGVWVCYAFLIDVWAFCALTETWGFSVIRSGIWGDLGGALFGTLVNILIVLLMA